MDFNLEKSLEILERTPEVLIAMLQGISADWTSANEGADTWSVYDILGHLIHGEKTDWIPRIRLFFRKVVTKNLNLLTGLPNLRKAKANPWKSF